MSHFATCYSKIKTTDIFVFTLVPDISDSQTSMFNVCSIFLTCNRCGSGSGVSHTGALLGLVRLQQADVDVTNDEGLTSLMIAATHGQDIIADVGLKFTTHLY